MKRDLDEEKKQNSGFDMQYETSVDTLGYRESETQLEESNKWYNR